MEALSGSLRSGPVPVQVVYHEDMGVPMIVRLAHVQVRVIRLGGRTER